MSEENTIIALETVISDKFNINDISYKLGSIVDDFKVTAVDGVEYSVSELLKEKKAIVLNFWFLNCDPCKMEFPYLQDAYTEFSDDIEVLALNTVDGTNEKIKSFADEFNLTFPMAVGDTAWIDCLGLTAYPTTVVIDRYGMVSMIHKGSVTEDGVFEKVFEYYTSDDYKQTTIRNLSDIE